MSTSIKTLVAVLLLAAPTARAAQADSAAHQFEARFGKKIRRALATPVGTDDAKLAAKLLQAAREGKGGPELRSLICQKAFEMGVRSPYGYGSAYQAMKHLAYVDPDRERHCLAKMAHVLSLQYRRVTGARKKTVGAELLDCLGELAALLGKEGKLAEQSEAVDSAYRVATTIGSPARTQLAEQRRHLHVKRAAFEQAGKLEAELLADPANEAVREKLIMLYLLDLDWPAKAAKVLTVDSDDLLRTYVPLAAKKVDELDPGPCMEMGLWYADLAGKASTTRKVIALTRAKRYLGRFLSTEKVRDMAYVRAKVAFDVACAELGGLVKIATPSDSRLLMTFDKGTLARSSKGTYVKDLSGRGNNGKATGPLKTVPGKVGMAIEFSAASGHVRVANNPGLQITRGQTIAMWLKPAKLGRRQNPFNKSYGGEGAMTVESDGTISYYYGTAGDKGKPYMAFASESKLQAGKWTHIALVRNLTDRRLTWYFDGRQVAATAAKFSRAEFSKRDVLIGSGYRGPFDGLIDELAVFARPLRPSQVQALYEMGCNGQSLRD